MKVQVLELKIVDAVRVHSSSVKMNGRVSTSYTTCYRDDGYTYLAKFGVSNEAKSTYSVACGPIKDEGQYNIMFISCTIAFASETMSIDNRIRQLYEKAIDKIAGSPTADM